MENNKILYLYKYKNMNPLKIYALITILLLLIYGIFNVYTYRKINSDPNYKPYNFVSSNKNVLLVLSFICILPLASLPYIF